MSNDRGPLSSIRVLDLGHNITAPVCANLLGALGADVIKVERPGGGDNSRLGPPFVGESGIAFAPQSEDDLAASFLKRNGHKRGVTLNLKDPRGRELFLGLVREADVVVENFRPGVMDKLGLSHGALLKANAALIVCSITGFGHAGPYRDWVAYDGIMQAFSGLIARTGYPDAAPVKSGFAAADTLGALFGAIGIMAALEQRRRTGRGDVIDVAMLDCLLSALWDDPLDIFATAGRLVRSGNNNQRAAPWNMYPANDGYVFICALTNDQWTRISQIMEIPADEDLGTPVGRLEHIEAVDGAVSRWCSQRPRMEIMATLQDAAIPCSAVLEPAELKEDPHVVARGCFAPLEHPKLGRVDGIVRARFPVRFASGANGIPERAPQLGEHNAEVFGLSGEELRRLMDEGVL